MPGEVSFWGTNDVTAARRQAVRDEDARVAKKVKEELDKRKKK